MALSKAKIRQVYVRTRDMFSGTRFARVEKKEIKSMPYTVELRNIFQPSETLDSKRRNLRAAAERINRVTVRPGEVFSFWHIVGDPNDRKRFFPGRSIRNNRLTIDYGGGLCQVSGIIHHLSLMCGIEIVERFNHSIDLYTDETRYAPLGTDATVFYGFKDLRLRNNLPYAIGFRLEVTDDELILRMESEQKIDPVELETDIDLLADGVKDVTIRRGGRPVSHSVYKPHR